MGERDRKDSQPVPEIEITPCFEDGPIYLETAMQLKRKGFAIDTITFKPLDTPGADIKITGEDATLVVNLVSFIRTIYPVGQNDSQDKIFKSISLGSTLLRLARARKQA